MSLNDTEAMLAFRNRLLTLTVATTGAISLAADAAGYVRTTGSFLTDGFAAGMELIASGFTLGGNNGLAVVDSVSALSLGIAGGRTVEAAAAGRTLLVGVPALRSYENKGLDPIMGRPFLETEYVPATSGLLTLQASGGTLDDEGQFVIRWNGVADVGETAITRAASAIKELFKPGTVLALSGGIGVRVMTQGPQRGAIRPDTPGWAVCTIRIPWRAFTIN